MKKNNFIIESGLPHPLGATAKKEGVNFSVFSENATSVELLIFKKHNDIKPLQSIELDPIKNRAFCFWHVFVRDLKPGFFYAYRVDGPEGKMKGFRFNKNKILIDPYARGNTDTLWNRGEACNDKDNLSNSMRSVIIDDKNYDWEGDKPLNIPMKDSIIYEMHVGGFTNSKTSGVKNPGTFSAVIEKIPYLKKLGITAVELLPVFEFDDREILRKTPEGNSLKNYWGYSTIGFFSPEASYCVCPEEGKHLNEFRNMVKALHKAGIEVILDVVFNHTNEGNHLGPVISFKGFDNSIYYYLVENSKNYYMDFSGCGNTLNCNHPIVEKFILECLEFWVKEMHVDGFRFDEGSILSRGEDGVPMKHPPLLWNIELSETFAETKLIAEAWDAGGLYEVGSFPGYRWAEWNGKFRDEIRRFVKGDPGIIGAVATRISGSADIYQHSRHKPVNSINFITCHDGFTMMDLVSFNWKHNLANGEDNRDGIDENLSWNCGREGETNDKYIINLRQRQIKNFVSILFLSRGVPMLLSGDEAGRTQKGNNNAYCQDNDLSWLDWGLLKKNQEIFRFVCIIIQFRKDNSSLREGEFFNSGKNERGLPDISWHGCSLYSPGWNDPASRVLAFTIGSFIEAEPDIHVMINMEDKNLDFEIPDLAGREWYRFADTYRNSPDDILDSGKEVKIANKNCEVKAKSLVILISKSKT